ncbi:Uncharacterised protein [Mycobacteroides abscessus subsp. abscessus]|nr:Uncharacterised protein [Mycobacteroides abscessus subsp. abscessus]
MPADTAHNLVTDAFDVYLPDWINLDGGIDRDKRGPARQASHVVTVFYAAEDRLTIGPIVELITAQQISRRRVAQEKAPAFQRNHGIGKQSRIDADGPIHTFEQCGS